MACQYTVLPWTVSGPPPLYEVHGHGSFPSKTDGHFQLPRRLAHSGPVEGGATIAQNPPPQPPRAPGTQGQFRQEHAVPQPVNIVPGNSSRLSSNESRSHARSCSGHAKTHGLLRDRCHSPSQKVSEDAGPHGRSIASTTAGPASQFLKPQVPSHAWRHGRLRIRVSQACVTALSPWKNPH